MFYRLTGALTLNMSWTGLFPHFSVPAAFIKPQWPSARRQNSLCGTWEVEARALAALPFKMCTVKTQSNSRTFTVPPSFPLVHNKDCFHLWSIFALSSSSMETCTFLATDKLYAVIITPHAQSAFTQRIGFFPLWSLIMSLLAINLSPRGMFIKFILNLVVEWNIHTHFIIRLWVDALASAA